MNARDPLPPETNTSVSHSSLPGVIKRDGKLVNCDISKVTEAVKRCCLDVNQGKMGDSHYALAEDVAQDVLRWVSRVKGATVHIEDIQDQVELSLMRRGEQALARGYVLFREQRTQERAKQSIQSAPSTHTLFVVDNGQRTALDMNQLRAQIEVACAGLGGDVKAEVILTETMRNLYDGIPLEEVYKASILAARTLIEKDPDYTYATARLLFHTISREVLGRDVAQADIGSAYQDYFPGFIKLGVESELLDPRLMDFDLERLATALKPERDMQFDYLGLQTLYDRYFLHVAKRRIELPQAFFMRVAMGLALNETDRESHAIEFYEVMSSFDFMSSTPTLFNSGTLHSQLSSCYLTTVPDDLAGIYDGIKENALLSKYAGGLGNDWSRVRALGALIKGTNGESQGVVPFLKVVNDTAVAVNQGGKRKGAVCAYLEAWHLDIEEFLELRKNTGDDRRRTHDMNTANWIPDLFMRRVMEKGTWTLFSPSNVPDLHDLFGADFEKAYVAYEEKAARGEIKPAKTIEASDLWRKMLTMLFETGHPWITFKDACNVRSPQQHAGVVHSSNLCTEITLNTSDTETAVCNLGSVNLKQHLRDGDKGMKMLDRAKLQRTIKTALRMLDNVIDINFYPVEKARNSNMQHRPVGMGLMGFQDALYEMGIPYASQEAVEFADKSMEAICYYAYWASTDLASERGTYSSYRGSLWDQGILPLDTLELLEKSRGGYVEVDRSSTMDWDALRIKIAKDGMRNSNCVAIAPTATISNIIGVDASIEPSFGNLSVKSNLSGEFTVINAYLVRDLKRLGLWDELMVADLKHFDGSLSPIDRVPQNIKQLYATAFEVETQWLVEAAARRQKWIDQAQSLNIYMAGASGKKLDETYKLAWLRGLKTTYYLRTRSASNAEKSTGRAGTHNAVAVALAAAPVEEPQGAFCSMRPGDAGYDSCESCQ